ncbi:MAG: phytanoyl-CoA dioxygenase family protein [Ectothiorhodospiraceae bacterium]|nr:phytanoyl-CoA dioxygenase family protein [Ectothiorhodospiraceae bacterium]
MSSIETGSRNARLRATARGEPVDPSLLGPLVDSRALLGDPPALREALARDGYLYASGFFPREDVVAARTAVLGRLASVDEIAHPPVEGIATGRSTRDALHPDRGAFWRSVSETWALRRVSHGARLHRLMDDLLDAESRAQDFLFLRPASRGKHTRVHCDSGFFTRETSRVLTAWIALGDVPIEDGPLFVLEGSHRFADVIESQRGFDVARDTGRRAAYDETPVAMARARATRILTGDLGAGDVIVFGMLLLHGALDNVSPNGRVRLSCDVRYQPAAEPLDPRYFGPEPTGTTGAGYGELVGAKPLTEDWHIR